MFCHLRVNMLRNQVPHWSIMISTVQPCLMYLTVLTSKMLEHLQIRITHFSSQLVMRMASKVGITQAFQLKGFLFVEYIIITTPKLSCFICESRNLCFCSVFSWYISCRNEKLCWSWACHLPHKQRWILLLLISYASLPGWVHWAIEHNLLQEVLQEQRHHNQPRKLWQTAKHGVSGYWWTSVLMVDWLTATAACNASFWSRPLASPCKSTRENLDW